MDTVRSQTIVARIICDQQGHPAAQEGGNCHQCLESAKAVLTAADQGTIPTLVVVP